MHNFGVPRQPRPLVTVLYFGPAATAMGKSIGDTSEKIEIPSNGITLSAFTVLLVQRHPNVKGLNVIIDMSQWSVNEEMVDDMSGMVLTGGEEVALIPPVSGG